MEHESSLKDLIMELDLKLEVEISRFWKPLHDRVRFSHV